MNSNILLHLVGIGIDRFTCLLCALQTCLCHDCWHDFIIKIPFTVFHMGPMNLYFSKWLKKFSPTISVLFCWFVWYWGGGISWRWYQEISSFRSDLEALLVESDNILVISDRRMLTSSSKDCTFLAHLLPLKFHLLIPHLGTIQICQKCHHL